jgi:precorrin-6A/cobalt-precorrin-6A reductase
MRNKVLLLSGTLEGPTLARALAEAGFAVVSTVTRPEAVTNLFGRSTGIRVECRGFTEESLAAFLQAGEADQVVDATHPFAVRITKLAHSVCLRLGVPYVRYERPDWTPPDGTLCADSFADAARMLPDLGRRIMLTIGSKQLKHFTNLHERLTQFARILPAPASIEQALAAGFTADRILCLRPPFSQAFNAAMFQEYRIDTLVTKSSGIEGGVREKVLAAQELGMHVLMIRRPVLAEIDAVATLDEVIAECLRKRSTR